MPEKDCSFCKREGLDPPALGSKATGSYRQIGAFEVSHPQVFNGYVCEMHADTIEWIKLNWKTDDKL